MRPSFNSMPSRRACSPATPSRRLGKEQLRAYQASPRGGEIRCRFAGERVELAGNCVFYLEGQTDFEVERGRAGAR